MKYFEKRPFDLVYDRQQGYFVIKLFNKPMLGTRLLARIGKREALLTNANRMNGIDNYGPYDQWDLSYVSPLKEKKSFQAQIRIYEDHSVFTVVNDFAIKGKKNKHLFGHPYISFPCFEGDHWDKGLSCLSFKRQAPFNFPQQWQGRAVDSLRDGKNIPLIITNLAYETLILSPLNQLLYGTVSISHFPKSIRCGIPRALTKIPKGLTYQTILVHKQGVNKAIDYWGQLLREHHGTRAILKDDDVLLKYLSYWTNAGSAYWYNNYKNLSYEDTLKALKTHHDSIGIRYGSYQLDSWWYKKEGDDYTSGIKEWEPKSKTRSKNFNSMFPFMQKYRDLDLFSQDKLSYVQKLIKTPIGCHFKQLSNDSVYLEGHEKDFLIEDFPMPKNKAVAKDLFKGLFYHPRWKMAYIVHDWLQFMYDNHSGFSHMKLGNAYFEALNESCNETPAEANKSGSLSIQFCMTQPHMTLYSVTMESVTSIRSTSDSNSFFVEGTKRWWWHMYSSKFIQALGKYAFYDNRQSYKSYVHPFSSFSRFELIWLGLSCGPIGIGDPIGKENVELLHRVIKEDGEIIKPDLPSQPLDQCYLFNPHSMKAQRGLANYSYSDIKLIGKEEGYRVYYMLLFNAHPFGRKVSMDYSLSELDSISDRDYLIYDYFNGKYDVVSGRYLNHYTMRRRKFYYHIITPIECGFGYIGDVSKHVTCSNQLISSIDLSSSFLKAEISYINSYRPSRMLIYSQLAPCEVTVDGKPLDYSYKDQLIRIDLDASFDVRRKGHKTISVKVRE